MSLVMLYSIYHELFFESISHISLTASFYVVSVVHIMLLISNPFHNPYFSFTKLFSFIVEDSHIISLYSIYIAII